MWSKGCPEYGRLRVSLYGTRDAATNWEDAYAKVLREYQFERGVACPCSSYSRVRGIKIMSTEMTSSDGLEHQLKWLEEVADEHFESKNTVKRAPSGLAKSLVMKNKKLWQDIEIAYIPDRRHCKRVVEALDLQHAKTVVTPAVGESECADGESTRECSWESRRAPYSQSEEASLRDVLDADKTSLYNF